MKRKLIGFCLTLVILAVSFAANVAEIPEKKRIHQHLEATEFPICSDHGNEKFCTHLPLVQIDTSGQEIPGRGYWENGETHYTTSSDGSDRIGVRITVTDHKDRRNHTDDEPELESSAIIHVRGHSSRHFDKASYKIKLVTSEGKNNLQSVMGMPAHSDWVLHGPFLDKTLLRNYLFYNLAGEMMDYAPNVRFCEVMINGSYEGVYVMTESIDAGEDGARLPLSVSRKDETYTGYLLRLDRRDAEDINNFTEYSLRMDSTLGVNIVFPGEQNLTETLKKEITSDFSDFEKSIYSYDFDDSDLGYEKLIDVDSFVDYFLINELSCNYDAGSLSTYIYKLPDNKFRMCVWDFNNSCDNYQEAATSEYEFRLNDGLWYWMLLKDKYFSQRIVDRYYELRKSYFSDEYLDSYIDDVIAYLGDAVDRNYERWGYSFESNSGLLIPSSRNLHCYEESVEQLREFLHKRTSFMDRNIGSLNQYSAQSKIKKYVENAN